MSEYYDRDGKPLTMMQWAQMLEKRGDENYKRVAETVLPDGKWVSTVWLGLDHQFGDGPPLIFETMVFPSRGEFGDLDCQRYSTEAEALAGHAQMVEKWSKPEGERD